MITCPNCHEPLNAVVIYLNSTTAEHWRRHEDRWVLEVRNEHMDGDVEQCCKRCGEIVSHSEVPGGLDDLP